MGVSDVIIRIIGKDNFTPEMAKVQKSLTEVGQSMTNIGRTMSLAITAPLVAAGTLSVKAASDLNESMNKTQVVFGEASKAIIAFADTAALNLGMTKQQALEATGTFGNLFSTMGIGLPQAAEMSQGLVQLAADLASFNNIDPGIALEKLRAGLVGEIEPLRVLGVNLSAEATQAKALAMGLAQTADALTPAMMAQARYALILEQTKNAQGDFARTSDAMANSLRIAKAQLGDAAATIGVQLIPVVTELLKTVTPLITQFTNLNPEMQKTILIVAGIAAALGPLLVIIGQLVTAIGAITPIVTAIVGVFSGPVLVAIAGVVAAVGALYLAWTSNFLNIRDGLTQVWESIKLVFAAFKAAFSGDWYEFGRLLREAWDNVWNYIAGRFGKAWEDLQTAAAVVVNNFINFFKNINWATIGTDIVKGIANGITSAVDWIITAVKGVGAAAIAAIKGFLGIKSPSTVFAGIGKQMMQGMAVGITGNQAVPAMAAAQAASYVTRSTVYHNTYNFNYSGNATAQQVNQSYQMAKLLG